MTLCWKKQHVNMNKDSKGVKEGTEEKLISTSALVCLGQQRDPEPITNNNSNSLNSV